jgi:hypothetical protein
MTCLFDGAIGTVICFGPGRSTCTRTVRGFCSMRSTCAVTLRNFIIMAAATRAGIGVPARVGCNALGLPNLPLLRFGRRAFRAWSVSLALAHAASPLTTPRVTSTRVAVL